MPDIADTSFTGLVLHGTPMAPENAVIAAQARINFHGYTRWLARDCESQTVPGTRGDENLRAAALPT